MLVKKIGIVLPGEPVETTEKVMAKLIPWLAEPPHSMEAVWGRTTAPDGGHVALVEILCPDDWDKDKILTFISMVGKFAWDAAND